MGWAEGVGVVLRSLGDRSRGEENADIPEFVITRCGAWGDVGTAGVDGVG